MMATGAAVLGGVGQAADDHGDTPLSATRVAHYGVSEAGRIEAVSDVDVFRLDLQGRAEIEVRGSGELDTQGVLYDSSGAVLAEDDDGGTDLNFRLVETLSGGVYYVAVSSDADTGAYKLTARIRRAGDDHGDTSGASSVLPLGIRVTGRIAPADDVDAFRIEVPKATGLRVVSSGPADTLGVLRDAAENVLTTRDAGGHGRNFRIERHVDAGVYYVHVTAAAVGSFALQANLYESARSAFAASISGPIVDAKCIACHVRGGQAGETRLVFADIGTDDAEAANFEALQSFVAARDDRAALILDKVRGLAEHGGKTQIEDGSTEFADLDRFLGLLVAEPVGNRRPVVGAVGDQTVAIDQVRRIAVAVDDNDGDSYSLHATSSNPCVVAAETAEATLELTGRLAGTAVVTVTADDGSGEDSAVSRPVSFTVTVPPPTPPDWALPRAAPADSSIEACAVADVLDHVFTDRAVQSVLLVAGDAVIGERYADGYDIASLGTSWSVAKSFYSAAIGVAIDREHIASLDQRASDFFSEWAGTDREDITIRDLLEMRAGLGNPNIFVQYDQTAFALAQNPVNARGTTFRYSNATSQLFEPLIRRATGMNAHDWLAETILEPIGVDRRAIGLWFDPTGRQPLTYCCLDMRPDDFARFGVLFANEGTWRGERLVSADYVRTSLTAHSAVYGLQWWVMNAAFLGGNAPPIDVSAAIGLEGQYVYVWRDGGVVLVVLTRYEHDRNQGYVLSLSNFPSTCAARNTCPDDEREGDEVPSYDQRTLLERLAALR